MLLQAAKRFLLPALAASAFGLSTIAAKAAEPGAERQEELRDMLAKDCATCHGESLRGDLGPGLSDKTLSGRSEDSLVLTILEGHEETAMPPWWWTLNEDEARWLVRFIRSER